jgi:hypothetical protein
MTEIEQVCKHARNTREIVMPIECAQSTDSER